MIILKLFAGLFIAWMLGHLIIRFFDPGKKLSAFEDMALSYLVGQGSVTLLLFLLFLLPIAHQSLIITLLVVGSFAVKMFYDKSGHWRNKKISFGIFSGFFLKRKNIIIVLLLIFLVSSLFIKISYSFVEACSKPEYAWDAAGNWTLAGKNYFYAEKYRTDKVVEELKNTVNSYPRGLSLMHYWLFWWMGEANDQWSKMIFPVELLCLLVIFYCGLKPARGQLGALVFVCFLCSAPIFLYHSTIGYADLTKTVYFAAGMIYFYRWIQTNQELYFWSFALPLAFTSWIKMEGRILYAIGFVLLLLYLWRDSKETLRSKIVHIGEYLLLFMVIGLPWQLFVLFNQLPGQEGWLSFSFYRFLEFHAKVYELLFLGGSWGMFWVLAAGTTLFFFKRQLSGRNFYLLAAILLFYGNLLFIYLCFSDTVDFMLLTFNRVLLPIYPVIVFNMGCVLPSLKIDEELVV